MTSANKIIHNIYMDRLRELQQEYLKQVMCKLGINNISALAKEIGLWPSTFNKFIKKGAASQRHLSAATLNKLHTLSGLTPPTTTKMSTAPLNESLLIESILDIYEAANKDVGELTLEQKIRFGIELYKKRSKEGYTSDKNKLNNQQNSQI